MYTTVSARCRRCARIADRSLSAGIRVRIAAAADVGRAAVIGIVSAATLAACAPATTGGSTEDPSGMSGMSGSVARLDDAAPSSLVFKNATAAEVWKVLPAAFNALKLEAGILDAANRIYGNQKVVESTIARQPVYDLFRCAAGSGLSANDYRVEFGIAAQPRKLVDGGTELLVQISAFGRITSPSRTGNTHCVSNGSLERALDYQIQAELQRLKS
jgi:hypothetical protein